MVLFSNRFKNSVLWLIIGLGLMGCSYLGAAFSNPVVIPIEEVLENKQENQIYLRGTVSDRVPLLDNGAYQLEDTTGKVWVLTNGTLPKPGEEITIKGQVESQKIPVQGYQWEELYVLELEKLAPQAQPESDSSNSPAKPKPVDDFLLPHKSQMK